MVIRKKGNKWGVYSHTDGKLLGTYNTKKEAHKAIERYKKYGGKKK
jgi:hypothetical protein